MFTNAAFGAIAGAILGLLLDPLLKALPVGAVIKAFIDGLAGDLLTLGLTASGALLSRRIRRLDHFIADHLSSIASSASMLFALSLWLNAGLPTAWTALASTFLSAAAAAYLLTVSGWTIRKAMQRFTPEQKQAAMDNREEEARAIAREAVFSGDPDAAVAVFATHAAGEAGEAYADGCLRALQAVVVAILTLLAATLAAHYLYGLPWLWAVVTGGVVMVAGMGLLEVAETIGTAHADRVPLTEKDKPILPSRDDA